MAENKGYKILIVDDEIEYQKVLSLILSDVGYDIASCSNGNEALEHIENNIVDLVLTDLKMPVMDGVELIKRIKEKYDDVDVIVMTAFGSIESAVDSIKYGAIDYFVKSGDMDELVMKVDRLAKIYRLERKSLFLLKNQNETELFIESWNEEHLKLLEMCKRAADTGINILLLGESGVGKEVIANYIHRLSKRRQEPFVPVNCQVFPEGVIESELFGHEKGSFTGAIDTRIGKFEQANLGTLFLDEIGDLPMATQGKLLRAIESRKIERLGSNKLIDLDVRFISATNKDLSKQIIEGDFREDLLYRINTLTLYIPPLRKRREDLPALINFFIKKIQKDQKKKIKKVDDEVMDFLLGYDYPGNIRELKNITERMIALSKDGVVTVNEILMPIGCVDKKKLINNNCEKTLKKARSNFEKIFISEALKNNNGNVAKTAYELEISTRQLWNKINQYKIGLEKV
ncbi:MAG: two component, sigma54 specific, transcriptional regulator, Fis family [Anaerosolibacter sp.]|jgi:DNA-binding NtrC family response regulator|uniref:sigma-54-dependent transcriptional regulator n=1 Tax=Anaerosolibacter sp. TaxID=1872527 RepID=UPI00260B854E|nr:sigma-54 dependent transcriptional regulator [Anaerosolibacter sp.]MDF2546767.1 two component, sigma54 specific, transcriptional regulator, Fis family [Anaerosolibacter sp.]